MTKRLDKQEKLKSRKLIEVLFSEGERVKKFPLQMRFVKGDRDEMELNKVGFSVPKRNIKLAVDRNRIKRLMREVYRKNKQLFISDENIQFNFMFIYMERKELKYEELELAFEKLSKKFLTKIQEDA